MERTKKSVNYSDSTENFVNVSEDRLFEYLSGQSFISIDKRMIKAFEPNVALFLINLMDFRSYLKSKELTEDDWFFCTHEQQQLHVNLTEKQMRLSKSILKSLGIVKTYMKGIPAKEWYFIDTQELYYYLETHDPSPTFQRRARGTDLGRASVPLKGRTNYKDLSILKLKNIKKGDLTRENPSIEITKKHPDQILFDKMESNGKTIDPIFVKPFMSWLKYKRNRGESYKDPDSTFLAYQKLVKLSNNNPKQAVEVIEQSMSNNWAGLFELNIAKTGNTKKPTTGYRSPTIVYREADREV